MITYGLENATSVKRCRENLNGFKRKEMILEECWTVTEECSTDCVSSVWFWVAFLLRKRSISSRLDTLKKTFSLWYSWGERRRTTSSGSEMNVTVSISYNCICCHEREKPAEGVANITEKKYKKMYSSLFSKIDDEYLYFVIASGKWKSVLWDAIKVLWKVKVKLLIRYHVVLLVHTEA